MSFPGAGYDDPWVPFTDASVQYNDLDLADGFVQVPPYVQANTGWITQANAHRFVHGCQNTNHRAKLEAYTRLFGLPAPCEPILALTTPQANARQRTFGRSQKTRIKGTPLLTLQGMSQTM